MNILEHQICFSAEQLILTNQRALFWAKEKTLILSDLHLGKAAHFRKNGIALPTQVSLQDLQRLKDLVLHFKAEKVIIVGDLIHSGANKEVALFKQFILTLPGTRFILIKGNHDRFSDEKWHEIGIETSHEILQMGVLFFVHQSGLSLKGPTISGHIHPGVRVRTATQKQLRLPCYIVSDRQLVLPAFSLFTGLDTSSVPGSSVCYAFYEEGIFSV